MKGEKAYARATLLHGKMYEYPGKLTINKKQKLYNEYLLLIRYSAYAGHVAAQYDLAQQYENMSFLGMPNPMYNPAKCVYWYSKACKANHAAACNNLAALYEVGEGCDKDLNRALELYKKSAELGYSLGKKNYKMMIRDLSKGGKYNR